jgi:heme/copper-type cytochrome/quinol oxidase subunit 2
MNMFFVYAMIVGMYLVVIVLAICTISVMKQPKDKQDQTGMEKILSSAGLFVLTILTACLAVSLTYFILKE